MRSSSISIRALALGLLGALWLAGTANAAEVRVMISGGLTAAFNALVPEFERQTGNKVLVAYGPSMGTTVARWSSVDDFLGAARDFLAAREAEHCLLFGLSSTIASQLSCWSCCTERLTDSRSSMFWRCHCIICRQASRSTRAPSAWIIPDSSAIEMNSAGSMMPRCGSRQRRSASTPQGRPVWRSIWGW